MIASLTNPREKIWGQLLVLRPEGITLRGIPVESFDDFVRQVARRTGEAISLTTAFYHMHRLERLARDEASAGIPSLADRFREQVGTSIQRVYGSHISQECRHPPASILRSALESL